MLLDRPAKAWQTPSLRSPTLLFLSKPRAMGMSDVGALAACLLLGDRNWVVKRHSAFVRAGQEAVVFQQGASSRRASNSARGCLSGRLLGGLPPGPFPALSSTKQTFERLILRATRDQPQSFYFQ